MLMTDAQLFSYGNNREAKGPVKHFYHLLLVYCERSIILSISHRLPLLPIHLRRLALDVGNKPRKDSKAPYKLLFTYQSYKWYRKFFQRCRQNFVLPNNIPSFPNRCS